MNSITASNPRFPHWKQIALPVSFALNLFFVAVIGGYWLSTTYEYAGTPVARALTQAEASLSPGDAAAFRVVIQRDASRYRQAEQQLRDARRALRYQVEAERFDPAGTRKALTAWRAAWNHFMDSFEGPLVDALAQVSPDGRRDLVARQSWRQPVGRRF